MAAPPGGPGVTINLQVPPNHTVVSTPGGLVIVDLSTGTQRGFIPFQSIGSLFAGAQTVPASVPNGQVQYSAAPPQPLPMQPMPQTALQNGSTPQSLVALPLPSGVPIIPVASTQSFVPQQNATQFMQMQQFANGMNTATQSHVTSNQVWEPGTSSLQPGAVQYRGPGGPGWQTHGPPEPAFRAPYGRENGGRSASFTGSVDGNARANGRRTPGASGARAVPPGHVSASQAPVGGQQGAQAASGAAQSSPVASTPAPAAPAPAPVVCVAVPHGGEAAVSQSTTPAGGTRTVTFTVTARAGLEIAAQAGQQLPEGLASSEGVSSLGLSVLTRQYSYHVLARAVRPSAAVFGQLEAQAVEVQVEADSGTAADKPGKKQKGKGKEGSASPTADTPSRLVKSWLAQANRTLVGGPQDVLQPWKAVEAAVPALSSDGAGISLGCAAGIAAPAGARVDVVVLACRTGTEAATVPATAPPVMVQPMDKVWAVLAVGSASSAPVVPGPVPGLQIHDASKSSLALKWGAAEDGGDLPGMTYEVEASEGQGGAAAVWHAVCRGPERSYEHKRLSPGTWHALRVRAVNSVGQGPWAEVRGATDARVPFTPSAPHCTDSQAGTIHLTWPALLSPFDGGSPVTSWTLEWAEGSPAQAFLQYQRDRGDKDSGQDEAGQGAGKPPAHGLKFNLVRMEGGVTSHALTGLRPEASYSFRLTAANIKGASVPSSIATYSTAGAPPAPPGPVSLSSGSAVPQDSLKAATGSSAPYAWQLAEVAGIPVATPGNVAFTWSASPSSSSPSSSSSPEYVLEYCQVGLSNGEGRPDKDIGAVTRLRAPGQAKGKGGKAKATLSLVAAGPVATMPVGKTLTAMLHSLPPNSAWQVRVACRNHVGQSSWSEWLQFVTNATLPGQATLISAQPTGPEPVRHAGPPCPEVALYPVVCGARLRVSAMDDGGAPITTVVVAARHTGAGLEDVTGVDYSQEGESEVPVQVPARAPSHPSLSSPGLAVSCDVPVAVHAAELEAMHTLLRRVAMARRDEAIIEHVMEQDEPGPADEPVQQAQAMEAVAVAEGQSVDVSYTEDGRWYRGTVQEQQDDVVTVLLPGLGVELQANVRAGQVRPLFESGASVILEGQPGQGNSTAVVLAVTEEGYTVTLPGKDPRADVPAHKVLSASSTGAAVPLPSGPTGPTSWRTALLTKAKGPAKQVAVVLNQQSAGPAAQDDKGDKAVPAAQPAAASSSSAPQHPAWFAKITQLHQAPGTVSTAPVPASPAGDGAHGHSRARGSMSLDFSMESWGDAMLDEEEEVMGVAKKAKARAKTHKAGEVPSLEDGWVMLAEVPTSSLGPLVLDNDGLPAYELTVPATAMLPGRAYEVMVRVATALGSCGWSAPVRVTVPPGAPGPLRSPSIRLLPGAGRPAVDLPSRVDLEGIRSTSGGDLDEEEAVHVMMERSPVAPSTSTADLALALPVGQGLSIGLGFTVQTAVVQGRGHWKTAHESLWNVMAQPTGPVVEVSGLRPGMAYWVRACAYNSAGRGPWTVPVMLRTAGKAPTAPQQPKAVLLPAPKALGPAVTNGVPAVTGAALDLGGSPGAILLISLVATALSSYRRARGEARRMLGLPQPAEELPEPPSGELAKAWPCVAEVTWEPPAEDFGHPVTGYRLCLAIAPPQGSKAEETAGSDVGLLLVNGRGTLDAEPRATSPPTAPARAVVYSGVSPRFAITGLAPGCVYHAKVQAVNAVGQGPWSSEVTVTAPPDVPMQPAPPTAAASGTGSNSVRIAWAAPSPVAAGQGVVTAYFVQRGRIAVTTGAAVLPEHAAALAHALNTGREEVQVLDRVTTRASAEQGPSMRLSKLQPSTAYAVRLAVENEVGPGPFGPWGVVFTTPAKEGAQEEAGAEDTPKVAEVAGGVEAAAVPAVVEAIGTDSPQVSGPALSVAPTAKRDGKDKDKDGKKTKGKGQGEGTATPTAAARQAAPVAAAVPAASAPAPPVRVSSVDLPVEPLEPQAQPVVQEQGQVDAPAPAAVVEQPSEPIAPSAARARASAAVRKTASGKDKDKEPGKTKGNGKQDGAGAQAEALGSGPKGKVSLCSRLLSARMVLGLVGILALLGLAIGLVTVVARWNEARKAQLQERERMDKESRRATARQHSDLERLQQRSGKAGSSFNGITPVEGQDEGRQGSQGRAKAA